MNIPTLLYSIEILSNINFILLVAFSLYILFLISAALSVCMDDKPDNIKKLYLLFKQSITSISIILFLLIIIPSKTTMYMMIGSKYLNDSSIPPKVIKMIELKIDKTIEILNKGDK